MSLDNKHADLLLKGEAEKSLVKKIRKIDTGNKEAYLPFVYKFPCHTRRFFHVADQKGIHLTKIKNSFTAGSCIMRNKVLPKNIDYTSFDAMVYKGVPCIVGPKNLEQHPKINMEGYDIRMSGQRKHNKTVASVNIRLETFLDGKPLLMLAQTNKELYVLGYYVLMKVKRVIKDKYFSHIFYFNRTEPGLQYTFKE